MIAIHNCPSTLAEGFSCYSPKASKMLFGGVRVNPVLNFDMDGLRTTSEWSGAVERLSVSGVQEKFPAVVENGALRLSRLNERSTHILKPAPWDKTLQWRTQIPANEHLTMQIAAQVYGISTAANSLCFAKSGQPVYLTKRFDILPDGHKMAMEDFASVAGHSEQTDGLYFKYSGCYEDIALAIRKNVAAWMVDIERFFSLIVFNYIYANGDAHFKNFSLILQGPDYRMAPAYDLLNTRLHINGEDFALDGGLSPHIEKSDVYCRTNHPCRLDFERFGLYIGVVKHRLNKILDQYMVVPELTEKLVERSFLTEKMKRSYLRIVNEQTARFVRYSE